jgi:hypothetical protein
MEKKPTHKHLKTGNLYTLIGYGKHSETLQEVAIYQDLDNQLWVRPKEMFNDGRFKLLKDE